MSDNIIIATGSIDKPNQVIDIIFAASQQKFGGKGFFNKGVEFMTDEEYNKLLDTVYVNATKLIKKKASAIGADAIINCKFDIEQLTLTESGIMSSGEALRIQVFVTGTAVKYI